MAISGFTCARPLIENPNFPVTAVAYMAAFLHSKTTLKKLKDPERHRSLGQIPCLHPKVRGHKSGPSCSSEKFYRQIHRSCANQLRTRVLARLAKKQNGPETPGL